MTTRGERNNNPLNIERTNIAWEGMAAEQTDPRFITWIDPKYCFRCASRIIREHFVTGRNTVLAIVNRWAPPVENDTDSYVDDVCQHMGVQSLDVLSITKAVGDPSQLLALLKGMVFHENGEDVYDDATIQIGMDMDAEGV